MKKALVVIPTYNERENVQEIIDGIQAQKTPWVIHVLVVDSNSPDGTGALLDELSRVKTGLWVYHQSAKLGLGRAYLDGFEYMAKNMPETYDAVVTMDADFSHHPRYLPQMLDKLDQFDLVVGSRYVAGGRLENWPRHRKWVSRAANFYATTLTGVPLKDLTAGFHCFRREALRRVLKFKTMIAAEGYAFLIELKFLSFKEGFRIAEIPIVFSDRTKGASKISKRVIFESALIPWKCLYDRFIYTVRAKRSRKPA